MLDGPCVPRWHSQILAAKAAGGALSLRVPGCTVIDEPSSAELERGVIPATIPCSPEAMRQVAETKLAAAGLRRSLPMAVYALARNVASEAGSGSPEEKIAIAEAALHRARAAHESLLEQMLRDGRYFGRQRGSNPAVATSRDPSFDDIVAAELVLSGTTENFSRGATHYFGPQHLDRFDVYERWTRRYGLAWVGPLPGVDPNEQFFMRKVGDSPAERTFWEIQYAAGRAVLAAGAQPPEPIAVCPEGLRGSALATIGALTALAASLSFYVTARWGRA